MSAEIPKLSFVIPCYNEEGNLLALITAIRETVEPLKLSYEVVITDDCSQDRTWEILKHLAAGDPRIRAQRFAFNCGQSAALWAGMQAARGRAIVTLDADLQNDPRDLPQLRRGARATGSSRPHHRGSPIGSATCCPAKTSATRAAVTEHSDASASRT
jgi:glycosyltransferase involved in cell wall biosynthesis